MVHCTVTCCARVESLNTCTAIAVHCQRVCRRAELTQHSTTAPPLAVLGRLATRCESLPPIPSFLIEHPPAKPRLSPSVEISNLRRPSSHSRHFLASRATAIADNRGHTGNNIHSFQPCSRNHYTTSSEVCGTTRAMRRNTFRAV
ncbi:hypothetical protein VTI28DRAFT_10130 [Corynascus sepedonium]